ncbi:divalent cation transporter domain-containing protein [Ditylenchus destructor]|nr:divalent cation transporter domain-containing protein [Ditylenchus destructor]
MSASVNAAFSTSLDQVTLDAGYGTVKSADTSNGSTSDNISQMAKDDTDSEVHGLTTHQAEPSLVLFFQVLFPFLIAGFGMVLAGIVLDIVQHWPLFKEVPETFILVPALLGLKGNLEMTLASRLSTQANTGQMDTPQQIRAIVIANMALIQTQAIVVTFLASGAAITLSWIPRGELDLGHAALLCASSLATASLASFLLSGIMILVVLFSRKMEINPDNVSTPIAASLGDLTTLAILSFFGSVFLRAHVNETWLNSIVIVIFLISLPFWLILARREPSTTALLKDGWSPIVFSMMISSSGGFVLERAMRSFPQMALFQPVINGVGGNLAAVHASRLATFFHKSSVLGVLPQSWPIDRFYSFSRAFFTSDWDARSARVLIFLVVPGHIIFNWLIGLLHTGENPPSSALFTSIYLLAALTQNTKNE